ncbi:CST complex subunit STN1 [Mucor ambiguus]|uniref:CST complex subunit STN1 n=1 Tax=Mucor ambiguus TaxID=91626 RepID=A0A0C9MK07_9FUNG|nr:CST complex subunit STN1 [Mucor ambiguus]
MDAALLGLDPLFLTHVKLTIHDLLHLEQANEDLIGVYKLFEHKIKLADICGTIVAVERNNYTTNYTVDDGTGAITCSYWSATEKLDYKPLSLGTTVRITGKISTYRDERQIVIYDIYPTFDPNQELQHFVQAILLRKEYKKPYELPPLIKSCADDLVEQIQVDDEDQLVYSSQAKKVDIQAFEDALLQFYRSRSLTRVSWNEARDNAKLEEMAKEILERMPRNKSVKEGDKSAIFNKATDKWLKAGYIYKIGKDNIYNVVDEEDLAKTIIRSIREMSKRLPDQFTQGGLTGPTVTPTVSIVPGSTSLITIPKASSIDLTSNFISGLPASITATATSTSTPQIIFVTGCNTCSSSSGAAATASIVNTTNGDQSKLSSDDLGAIIGGCAGGLVVIVIATVFFCIRRRKRRDFYAGRDFPISAVIPPSVDEVKHTYPASVVAKEPNNAISNNSFYIDNNDSTIKRYNLSTAAEDTAHDTIATPPVILYSDSLNNQQQTMGVEKYMMDSGVSSTSPTPRPSKPLERKVSQGARLSKYNFLSQAFSQMRTSYAGDNHNAISMNATTTVTAPKTLNTDPTHNHDSMVLPHDKPKNHPMYQQQDASFQSLSFPSPPPLPIPAMASTSSFFDPNTTRESTMTVATLHAPLFRQHQYQQQRGTPSPSSLSEAATVKLKQPYTSHLAVPPTSPIRTAGIDADSVVSDVSQYSSKRSFSTTASAALKQDNKPYPYF